MTGKLFFTGDTHGEIERFGYKNFPQSRDFDKEDVVAICGDCGFVWNDEYKKDSKQDSYALRWLNDKGYTFILVCGNHCNFNMIEKMPVIERFNGHVRQCVYKNTVYENLFYVDDITTLDLNGKHCLIIPKADSHDKEFRTEGISWWPQEKGNIGQERKYIEKHKQEHYDFIITHDCAGYMNDCWKPQGVPGRLINTLREMFFEDLRKTLDYNCWVHGHMHEEDFMYGNNERYCLCLYHNILSAQDIEKMFIREITLEQEWKHNLFK